MNKKKYILLYIISIITVFFFEFIERCYNIEYPKNEIVEYKESILLLILTGVILAPIVEEIMFRHPFVKSKFSYISLIIGSLLILLMSSHWMFWILYLLTNITTFYLYYYKKYSKIPYFILLIYSILFIFLHTENYKMDEILKMPFYNILLLFSSQITLTIILGYIRIKSKRLYPTILFHSIYNLTIVLLSILDL